MLTVFLYASVYGQQLNGRSTIPTQPVEEILMLRHHVTKGIKTNVDNDSRGLLERRHVPKQTLSEIIGLPNSSKYPEKTIMERSDSIFDLIGSPKSSSKNQKHYSATNVKEESTTYKRSLNSQESYEFDKQKLADDRKRQDDYVFSQTEDTLEGLQTPSPTNWASSKIPVLSIENRNKVFSILSQNAKDQAATKVKSRSTSKKAEDDKIKRNQNFEIRSIEELIEIVPLQQKFNFIPNLDNEVIARMFEAQIRQIQTLE